MLQGWAEHQANLGLFKLNNDNLFGVDRDLFEFSQHVGGHHIGQAVTGEGYLFERLSDEERFDRGLSGVGKMVDSATTAASVVVGGVGIFRPQINLIPKGNVTREILEREALGADGATSRHIIEHRMGKTGSETISKTHQVTKDGKIIHQHQEHIGKNGRIYRFPDEWTGTETINAP